MTAAVPIIADPAHEMRQGHAAVHREVCAELTLGIVHEMNNLTGGIAVLSEIYLQSAESGMPVTEGLELIHKSTGRLQALVRHLHVIHGPVREEPTYFNVAEFVRSVLELLAPMLPKQVTVETDFPTEELAVCLDSASLRQVILDLTLNLRDTLAANSDAGRRLRFSLRRLSAGKAGLVLSSLESTGADIYSHPFATAENVTVEQARLDDADQTMREIGGRLVSDREGEYVLELPLIV